MSSTEKSVPVGAVADCEQLAAEAFARRRAGDWSVADQAAFEARVAHEPEFAGAVRRVEESWHAVATHATSPELMALREQALARARRANGRRWLRAGSVFGAFGARQRTWRIAASVVGAAVALGVAVQLSPYGFVPGQYRTSIGEQRVIELDDRSRVALDSKTRMRVRFSDDARIVQLLEGQAQFSVAKDPARPFKVEAGEHTIVAVGTVFTVEYVAREVHVAMIEGKVAVLPSARLETVRVNAASPVPAIELEAGEALHVREDGHAEVEANADLEAATAWREGKVIFHGEPLGEAARRLNRYSRVQLKVEDPTLASLEISGVFEAGDTQAFAEAVASYLPVNADYSERGVVRLKMR